MLLKNTIKKWEFHMNNKEPEDFYFEIVEPLSPDDVPFPEITGRLIEKHEQETES